MPQVLIDPARTGLVLFDMLNHYMYPSNPDRARVIQENKIMEHSARLTRAARAAGIRIFYANGSYRADGMDYAPTVVDADMELNPWPDGPRLMEKGAAIEDSTAASVIAELTPQREDFIIAKHRWSAFAGTPLDLLLRGLRIDAILLAGGSTDIGILATASAARDLGYHLIILRDACYSHRPGAQDFCMNRLFPRMARVMTVEQAIGLIVREKR